MREYTFYDLYFDDRKHPNGGIQAIMEFDNGHKISVVGGPGTYGDGINTFEVWRSIDDNVKGYLSKDEVTELMEELQKVPKETPFNQFGYGSNSNNLI